MAALLSWPHGPLGFRQNKRFSERILCELLTDSYQWHEATTTDAVRSDTTLNPSSGGNGGSCGDHGPDKAYPLRSRLDD